MNHAPTHTKVRNNVELQVSGIPFADLPGQSVLIRKFLAKDPSLSSFYPNVIKAKGGLGEFAATALAEYPTDRNKLADALTDLHRRLGATEASLANIRLLRESDVVAVVTGQQAGLFSGPLYTIYKAISAIKQAEVLTSLGQRAVPVFWTASEDHDIDEVSEIFLPGSEGDTTRISYRPQSAVRGRPVGMYTLDSTINDAIDNYFGQMERTEFSDGVRNILEESWADGVGFADAFSRSIIRLLGNFGIIILDPLDPAIKRLAAPIIADAVESTDEIVNVVRQATAKLEGEGFHSQVLIEKDYVPYFWIDDDGRRTQLRRANDGTFRPKHGGREFSASELKEIASKSPERVSPGVALRPVVQDYLLPTVCYFGGAAEVAYFAQISESYKFLNRPMTPIFHRQSFTVVSSRQRRTLDRYGLSITDLFEGKEKIQLRVSQAEFGADLGNLFVDADENIGTELDKIDQKLSETDPTLAASLAKRRRKILYHIAALKRKTLLAEVRRDDVIKRRIDDLFSSLLPNGGLQERSINVFWFLNKYGPNFIDWLYEAADLDDNRHRVIDL